MTKQQIQLIMELISEMIWLDRRNHKGAGETEKYKILDRIEAIEKKLLKCQ